MRWGFVGSIPSPGWVPSTEHRLGGWRSSGMVRGTSGGIKTCGIGKTWYCEQVGPKTADSEGPPVGAGEGPPEGSPEGRQRWVQEGGRRGVVMGRGHPFGATEGGHGFPP